MPEAEIEAHRHKRGPVRKRHRRKGFDLERITDDLEREEVPPCGPAEEAPK